MEKELNEELVVSVEDELKKRNEEFERVWNEGDYEAISSFFTEDAVRVGFYGEKSNGRDEIKEAFKKVKEKFPGAKLKFQDGQVRLLGEDYAVWQAGFELTKADNSEPLKGYVVQISQKVGDHWLVVEAHPKLLPGTNESKN